MNKPLTARQLGTSSQLTTVFTSGNSQAVRLPKAFRFNEKKVEILRRGDEVVLRPHRPTLGEVMADLPPLSSKEIAQWDEVMAHLKSDQGELRERDWSWLSDDAPATSSKATGTAKTPRPGRTSKGGKSQSKS